MKILLKKGNSRIGSMSFGVNGYTGCQYPTRQPIAS